MRTREGGHGKTLQFFEGFSMKRIFLDCQLDTQMTALAQGMLIFSAGLELSL